MRAFVALALWRYDMQPVKAEEEAFGVRFMRLKQVEGDDMTVKVNKRGNWLKSYKQQLVEIGYRRTRSSLYLG